MLSGADFHASLAQIAAKKAALGNDQIEIQGHLLKLLKASSASDAGHERHARWRTVMADKGGELSRICTSAYRKFNDDAVADEFGEADDLASLIAMDSKVFAAPQLGDVDMSVPVFATDEWPYGDSDGHFAHKTLDLTTVEFNMHPIYVQKETVVLFAEPKMGKTAVSLTSALHIACGMDFGPLKVHGQGAVIYYALEGQHAINLRVEAWKKEMLARGAPLPDNIPMYTVTKPANFIKEASRVEEAGKMIAAAKYAERYGTPLKAIFIDTLTKAMTGGDQNSVEDTSHLFEVVSLIRAAGVTATIVFVHHKARAGHARGSSNIEAEPDMLLDVTKEGSVIKLRVARARSIEDGANFSFQISTVELGTTTQGHPLTSMFVEPIDGAATVAGDDDYHAIQQLAERRKLITSLGSAGKVAAKVVVEAWFKAGLIKGTTLRGGDVPPNMNSAPVKEALVKVVDNAGGQVYGDCIIRTDMLGGEVVGFTVQKVS